MSVNRKIFFILPSLALGLIFLIPVTSLIILANINLNHYKPQLEKYFHTFTGRTLKLNGNIDLDIINNQLTPRLEIEDASISNASWGQKHPMLVLGKIQLQFQLLPLINKIILIDNIQIENTSIIVENNRDGISNWQFDDNSSAQQSAPKENNNLPNRYSFLPVIHHLALNNIKVDYIDKLKPTHINAIIQSITLKEKRNNLDIIKAQGKINNKTFNFSGKISNISHILNDDNATVILYGKTVGTRLNIDGEILHPLSNLQLDLNFKLSADNINHTITLITGTQLPPPKIPLHLSGHISSRGKTYSLDKAKLALANNKMNISASLSLAKSIPSLKIKLFANTLHINSLKMKLNKKNRPTKKSVTIKKEEITAINIPNLPIRFRQLNTINADIDFNIKKIITGKIETRNNQLIAKLKNGNLEIKKLSFNYSKGSITVKSDLIKKPGTVNATLDLHIRKLDLANALASFNINSITKGYLDTNIRLTSSANNLRDLLFNSSGPAEISVSNLDTTHIFNKNSARAPVYIQKASLKLGSIKKQLSYSIVAKIKNQTLTGRGTLNSLYTLITGKPYHITNHIYGAGANGKINVYFSDPFNFYTLTRQPVKINTDIKIRKPKDTIHFIESLFPKLEIIKDVPDRPIFILAKIDKLEKQLVISDMEVKIGDSDIHGSVLINTASNPVFVQSRLSSKYINLNQLLPKTKKELSSKKNTNKKIKPLSKKPLNLKFLKKINADITLNVNKIDINSYTINKLHIPMILNKGNLTLDPLTFIFSNGQFITHTKLTNTNPPEITASLLIKKMDYGELLQTMGQSKIVTGKLDVDLHLHSSGNSINTLIASLNGGLTIKTVNGRLDSNALDLFSKNLASLLPFTGKQNKQDIRCGVANFDIKQGVARARAIIFDTGLISVLGTGRINLNNEKISFYIEPHAKKTSLAKLALIPINISGTIHSLSVTPNLAGMTVSTGKNALNVGLAIATGGISLVAEDLTNRAWKTIIDTNDYCAMALSGKPIKVRHISILKPSNNSNTSPPTIGTHKNPEEEWDDW